MNNSASNSQKNTRSMRFLAKANHLIILFLLLSAVAFGQSFETVSVNPFSLSQVTGGSNDVVFGDLNGDGLIDIISGNSLGRFYFFENDGTTLAPSFKAAVENPYSLTDIGQDSRPFIIDLNGDGLLDVISGENGGNLYFFENEGTVLAPSFKTVVQNPFGLSRPGGRSSITFVDLDGDGDLDALTGKNSGDLTYKANSAGAGNTPVFGAGQTNPFGLASIGGRSVPRFTDLDGDGDFDMLSGHQDGSLYYFENSGTNLAPAFEDAVTNPFNIVDVSTFSAPGVVDLDGDGDLDLLVGDGAGDFNYFENLCANSFSYDKYNFNQSETDPTPATNISGGTFSVLPETGLSINATTGEIDLSASDAGDYSVTYTTNTCSLNKTMTIEETFEFATQITNPFFLPDVGDQLHPAFADLDNDGDQDLLVGELNGDFIYFENIGSSERPSYSTPLENPFSIETILNKDVPRPTLADMDGDGDFDIVVGFATGDYFYYQNEGTVSLPDFKSPMNLSLSFHDGYATPFAVDLDGDGDTDLLSGTITCDLFYFENTAGFGNTPTFAASVTNPFSLSNIGEPTAIIATPSFGDLDDDGDLDLLAGNGDGEFHYFENVGTSSTPSFLKYEINPFSLGITFPGVSPVMVDLDNDGDLDVFTGRDYGDNHFGYYRNKTIDNLTAYVSISQELTCQDGSDGSITASPTGGDGNYTYAWDNGITETTATVSGLAAGTYTVTVTDGLNATSTASITLEDGPLTEFSYEFDVHYQTDADPTPTTEVSEGTFSAPTGLVIDTNTGVIDVSESAIGAYTITYTPTGCVAITTDIIIAKKPTFAMVVMNPFNLTDIGTHSNPTLADLDNDGDLDLLSGNGGDNSLQYFENVGTALIADFSTEQTNPFGIEGFTNSSHGSPILIDIDGDDDFDIIGGDNYAEFFYHQNVGSDSDPIFTTAQAFPFGLNAGAGQSIDPSMADLDGDGDIDVLTKAGSGSLFFYYENTAGSGNTPIFDRSTNPFGLPLISHRVRMALTDLDGDGDIDLLINELGLQSVFKYFINIGTTQNPIFSQNTSSSISLPSIDFGAPTFVDLDNDGDLDIITGAEDGNFYYHRNLEIDNLTAYVFTPQVLTCQGGSDGSITASPTGGDGNYTYVWDNGISETTATVSGLAAGTYEVTVTDGLGATSTATITLDDGPLEDADFTYDASVYITTGSNPTPTVTTPGGSFSSVPTGLIFEDSGTGEIAVANSEVGIYTVTYTTATCGDEISKTVEITKTLTWDGDEGTAWATANNWDFNVAPSSSNNLVIPDVTFDPSIFVTVEVVNNLEIESGATLTIAGGSLKVNGDLVLSGDISVASEASLLLMGSVSGGGSATINRNTTFGTTDGKYSVIGSPITSGSTSSLGSIVYKYDESIAFDGVGNNRFVRVSSPETMEVGDAYFSANTGDISFTGIPNSGNIDINLNYSEGIPSRIEVALPNDYALVSNSYTAAISYDLLMAGNNDIDGTLYFWDDGGSNVEQRDNSDYITATSMGAAGGGSTRSTDWDGYIRSTQGFFVAFNSPGTFHLTPTMMVTSNNDDGGYFRKMEGEILRLALSSKDFYSDILVGFTEEATNDFDRMLDAYKIKGNGDIQLYSRMGEEIMAIQALPFSEEERKVDIGFDAAKAETYTLEISDFPEGDLQLYLIDHLLNKKVNLIEVNSYTFSTATVEDSHRFSLLFAPDEVLSIAKEEMSNELLVYSKDQEVFLKTKKDVEGATISIYTLNGTLVQQVSNVSFYRSKWGTSFNGEGVFIVTVQSENEFLVSKFHK